jgi:hypothetical protein
MWSMKEAKNGRKMKVRIGVKKGGMLTYSKTKITRNIQKEKRTKRPNLHEADIKV